jgi:hypothetical protein
MAKATTTKGKKTYKKKERKNIPVGIVHIAASFNNTLISITDSQGNLVAQSSSGARGFRGSRKGTPFRSSGQRSGRRSRISDSRDCSSGNSRNFNSRHDADSAQRLQTAETQKSLRIHRF